MAKTSLFEGIIFTVPHCCVRANSAAVVETLVGAEPMAVRVCCGGSAVLMKSGGVDAVALACVAGSRGVMASWRFMVSSSDSYSSSFGYMFMERRHVVSSLSACGKESCRLEAD